MATRLFRDDDRWTDEANAIERELTAAISPIFEQWFAAGYSIRDIAHIASSVVHLAECSLILETRYGTRPHGREDRR